MRHQWEILKHRFRKFNCFHFLNLGANSIDDVQITQSIDSREPRQKGKE
jgi:hypothetical protein